ncbi:MAG TPA: 50S ribosomal protein L15e [Candidatus Nanoarchaeia archaeon]|nr:50S ribosomal protein L15e [Candidatus Nanoarchaeia archaeon]
MGVYQHIREAWKKPQETIPELWRERLLEWRREPATVRVERPTRLDRARSLGYKAKQGIIIVRQRVLRGGHTRPQIHGGGRRSKRSGTRLSLRKNYQLIAEERANRKYENLTVLNSYWVSQDGKYAWYEVILVDPEHPVIRADPSLNWITAKKHLRRVFHGKTSAGQKMRGLQQRGKGVRKARPSRRAHERRQ